MMSFLAPRLYNLFMLNSNEYKYILLINVKMPTMVGILHLLARQIQHLKVLKLKTPLFIFCII